MLITKPSDFQPVLRDELLATVAGWLMDEWSATEDDLVRETDSAYTRGTTCFGRQRQRILKEYLSNAHPWLGIENSANDLVFSIGGVPCRFSNDSLTAPTKRAVLEAHRFQLPLIEDAEPGQAVRFCFVVDRGIDERGEPRIELLGFTATDELVCRWRSATPVRTLMPAKADLPPPVEIAKPVIVPKRRDVGGGGETAASAGP
jgi:hypothetical protein